MSSPAELLRKVRKVEIKSRRLSQRLFSGDYHSAFKGRGMTFSEVRPYSFGDDPRFIDWNVTARYNTPYVKIFEEERELTVILLIDLSASDDFGTGHQTKADVLAEIAAVLSFSAIANNDQVGVIFFTDKVERFIPPGKGRSHILRIIKELIEFKPRGSKTDIGAALKYLTQVVKKRSIAFLLSDMLDEGYAAQLSVASRKHELVGFRLFDALEAELPDAGLLHVQDAETGQLQWIDTSDPLTRSLYKFGRQQLATKAKESFLKSNASFLELRTDQPYLPLLHAFFQGR